MGQRQMNTMKAIDESASFYSKLMSSALDAFICTDSMGIVLNCNQQTETVLGWTCSEFVHSSVQDLIIPRRFRELYAGTCRDVLAAQKGKRIELSVIHRDAYEFPAELTITPVSWNDGAYVTIFLRDVSERKEIEQNLTRKAEELARSNADLETFAYVASHDLQEPLRMVASYTQLLAKRYTNKLDSDANEFIAFAVDGAVRMQQLIQDLLSYSRLNTTKKIPHFVLAEAACKSAVQNLKDAISAADASICVHKLPAVLADPVQLTQLFQNLIGNAIKYRSDRPPKITVSAAGAESQWVFSIQDNGIGIEDKYFDRIFQMFQRLHTRNEYPGTGIGLAICRRIVERHGGKIWVESQCGHGSTFFFSFPRAERIKE